MAMPQLATRLALRDYPQEATPVMEHKWRNLLFLHWEFDPAEIQKTLPPGLYADTYQGKAYVGVVSLFINDVRIKGIPSFLVPAGLSDLLEVNLRTYVYDEQGMPGVWFYTLEANNQIAAQMANRFFSLPYNYADIQGSVGADHHVSFKWKRPQTSFSTDFQYQPVGEQFTAEPDTLEFFLIERYVLFAYTGSRLISGRIHHAPYSLSQVQLTSWNDQLFDLQKLPKPNRKPDHMLFSPGVNVDIFTTSK